MHQLPNKCCHYFWVFVYISTKKEKLFSTASNFFPTIRKETKTDMPVPGALSTPMATANKKESGFLHEND